MNFNELSTYNLADAIKFHNRLNPGLWGSNEHLLPEVQKKLLEIAADFQEFLGVSDLEVEDITISGSNAAYSYTPHSDIDLHLVVRKPKSHDEVYQELFNAKKYQYNDEHDIRIRGADVELYVQDADETPVSLGEYSIKNNKWIQVPRRKRASIDQSIVKHKYEDLKARIESALKDDNAEHIAALIAKIKTMRQTGLDQHGEFGPENLAFKMLRTQGLIKKLYNAKAEARDRELSLKELARPRQAVRYGFSESSSPNGVSPETKMFLSEVESENVVRDFIAQTVKKLNIRRVPKIQLHRDDGWSQENHSFGQFVPETNQLHVSLVGRHLLDILRTTAHELAHCRQHEINPLPDEAGQTGSKWENQANATAGVIMRDFADANPELFDKAAMLESSGYIPTQAQKNDPRFVMALSPDVRPGQTGREANKMGLKTNAQGKPALLMKTANLQEGRLPQLSQGPETLSTYNADEDLVESLRQEFALLEDEFLFEIKMTGKNLRTEAAKTGAQAGMEFEMIVPNMEGADEEAEMEVDMDQDERSRSFSRIEDFFLDNDYNGRREIRDLMSELDSEFQEWIDDQASEAWDIDALRDYIANNDLFDRDEALDTARDEIMDANPDLPPESEEFQQLLSARVNELEEQFVEDEFDARGNIYDSAYEEFMDLQRLEADQSDFLQDRYPYMSDIANNFDITWPYYTTVDSDSGASIDMVADEFSNYMGKPVNASASYHRAQREAGKYVVEPDGSLEGDNPGDMGLEFVSPPMPIDEMIADLNKVKKWAGSQGAYTNDSTGLHINISVPNYSLDKLDYVKLALLMGDEYVLDLFGRSSNTYTKAATGKIRDALKKNPDLAPAMMDKMRGHMEDLATKAIHTGTTDKYTSINTKTGYIEFRSPGGDWLDENFSKIENTLLRFTVALSAAINPEAYRQEYLKKLYKLLEGAQDKGGVDVVQLFANYSAGDLDKAALIRQVRAKQLARDLDKGKAPAGKKYWWSVGRPGYFASVEVVAASKEEAIEKGKVEYPDWRNSNDMTAKPLRPYEEPDAPLWYVSIIGQPGTEMQIRANSASDAEAQARTRRPDIYSNSEGNVRTSTIPVGRATQSAADNQGNWGIWIRASDRFARVPGEHPAGAEIPLRRFATQQAAEQYLAQTREQNPRMRTDVEVREIPADYQVPPPQGRVYNPNQAQQQQQQQGGRYTYRVFTDTNQTVGTFQSDGIQGSTGAMVAFRNYLRSIGRDSAAGFNYEEIGREREASQDNWSQDFERRMSQPAAGSNQVGDTYAPGGSGEFTGQWLVVDANNRILYKFGGVGNSQSDANRIAIAWLRQNASHMQAGVEVVPEMG